MAIVAVLYEYTDDTATLEATRPAHREFLYSQPNLLVSGPTEHGGIIVFEGEVEQVEALMDTDPYKAAGGIIASRTITEWTVTGGSWKVALGI